MSRTVITSTDVPTDGYATRLLKYMPSEVIALYLTLTSLVRSSAGAGLWLDWLIFAVGVVATPLYLWRLQKVRKPLQLVISTGAFVVWAFALGAPFAQLTWYAPVYGGVLLSMYTFLIPIIEA